ncbi:unnamed protein product [Linum trigynum]|uniref:TF-B3 domain-containing protein n=1 Tax=Linum trigynum TaxID=586398 RepID=A0AAV2GEV2_9ROSI
MEAEEGTRTCNGRSWEEYMYWTHFQFTHFCRFLHSDFHHSLAIPTKFSTHMSSRLPGTVALRGPSGIDWAVGVAMSDDGTLFFSGGWKEFAQDHGLQAGDLLIFRFNGHSQFDVLVLESESSCEKTRSYFLSMKQGPPMEVKKAWGSTAAATPSGDGCGGFIPSPEQHDGGVGGVDDGTGRPLPPIEIDVDTLPPHPPQPPPPPLLPSCPPFITKLSNKQAKKVLTKKVVSLNSYRGASTPTPPPTESKLEALRLAKLAVSKDGFLTVMKTTHVERTFYLAIPYSWMKKHMDERERQDMILTLGEKEWPVKFKLRVNKNAGGLTNGWKKFARDNNLQQYDVCVFDLGGERRGPDPESSIMVLKVQIFR